MGSNETPMYVSAENPPQEPDSKTVATASPKSHYARRSWLFALIGIGVLGLAVYFIGPDRTANAVLSVPLKYFFLLCLLEAVTEWGRALKWRVALGREACAVSLFFLSKAGGNLSPARLGEFFPLVLPLYRNVRTGAWIFADRMVEASATVFLGCCGLLFMLIQKQVPFELKKFLLMFLGTSGLLLAVLVGFSFLFSRVAQKPLDKFPLSGNSFRKKFLRVLDELQMFWRQMPLISSLTLFFTAVDVFAGVFLYGAFGFALSFWLVAVASALHGIVSISPVTPSATGIPYVAAGTLLHLIGGVPYEAVAGAVVVHVVIVNLVFWGSTGLALLFFRGFPTKDKTQLNV